MEEVLKTFGKITKVIPGGDFIVKLENGHCVHCHVSGKIRKNYIKLLSGDEVTIEISSYDINKGRIIYRGRRV
jgi:translation initiation factor IF-1